MGGVGSLSLQTQQPFNTSECLIYEGKDPRSAPTQLPLSIKTRALSVCHKSLSTFSLFPTGECFWVSAPEYLFLLSMSLRSRCESTLKG